MDAAERFGMVLPARIRAAPALAPVLEAKSAIRRARARADLALAVSAPRFLTNVTGGT